MAKNVRGAAITAIRGTRCYRRKSSPVCIDLYKSMPKCVFHWSFPDDDDDNDDDNFIIVRSAYDYLP